MPSGSRSRSLAINQNHMVDHARYMARWFHLADARAGGSGQNGDGGRTMSEPTQDAKG